MSTEAYQKTFAQKTILNTIPKIAPVGKRTYPTEEVRDVFDSCHNESVHQDANFLLHRYRCDYEAAGCVDFNTDVANSTLQVRIYKSSEMTCRIVVRRYISDTSGPNKSYMQHIDF